MLCPPPLLASADVDDEAVDEAVDIMEGVEEAAFGGVVIRLASVDMAWGPSESPERFAGGLIGCSCCFCISCCCCCLAAATIPRCAGATSLPEDADDGGAGSVGIVSGGGGGGAAAAAAADMVIAVVVVVSVAFAVAAAPAAAVERWSESCRRPHCRHCASP